MKITVTKLRRLLHQYDKEEISISRFAELLNEDSDTSFRRHRLDLNQPAELAIYNAMQEVEKMPADERLTKAVTLLSEAKNLVADYIDAH
jgi:hypothetical protein